MFSLLSPVPVEYYGPAFRPRRRPARRREAGRRTPFFLSAIARPAPMTAPPSPPAPPKLQELRREIDAIDEQVHSLLMQRADIIDRLISVKQTQEVGSAFRPAREADMMKRLVQRHRGILPLDTVESIWRVIIATFTYVQAPFAVHADLSPGESAMRDSARFHFGFTVPFVAHFSAAAAVEAVAKSKGDLALIPASGSHAPWWQPLEPTGAPKIIARLPFIERADHPAALPVFVISRVADDARVTDVEMWSIRVSGWSAAVARAVSPLAEVSAVPDGTFDGAALLASLPGRGRPDGDGALEKLSSMLLSAGATVRSTALVGSHATRYTVPAPGAAGAR
jgi:chorismate mutase